MKKLTLSNNSFLKIKKFKFISLVSFICLMAAVTFTLKVVAAPDTEPPTIPANFTATKTNSSNNNLKITLNWQLSSDNIGVTKYRITIKDMGLGRTDYGDFNGGNLASFSYNIPADNKVYEYQIFALDGAGNKSSGSNVATLKMTTDKVAPSKPQNLSVQEVTVNDRYGAKLSWSASTDNEGVAKYVITRTDHNNNNQKVDFTASNAQTIYDDLFFRINTGGDYDYSYVVTALDSANNASLTSDPVNFKSAPHDSISPTAPSNLTAYPIVIGDRYGARLEWTASTDNEAVSHYSIIRTSIDGSFSTEFKVDGRATTYDDLVYLYQVGTKTDPLNYTVRAYDAYGNASEISNTVHVDFYSQKGGDDEPPAPADEVSDESLPRTSSDRADDSHQPMIHTMYVLPSDGTDRRLDTNGQISSSVESFSTWFNQASGGLSLRIDKFSGKPDISYYRLPKTAAHYSSFGDSMATAVANDLKSAGLFNSNKIYSIYYEGGNGTSCGGASWPPELPGQYAVMFIKNKPGSSLNCETSNIGSGMNYWEFAMLHDTVHAMGFVQPCAPNYNPSKPAHVVDDPRDLMYTGSGNWNPSIIDVGNNDYFKHNNACADLEDSPYLIRPYVPAILEAPNCLYPGQSLRSPNGRYSFHFQATDRNLVIYSPYRNIWQNHSYGKGGVILCMQGDGILGQYNSAWQPVWYTPSHISGGKYLAMQDDGNLVIYNASWQPVWAS